MNTANYRAFPIVGGASCATLALFFLMQGLVAKDTMSFVEERTVFDPNIVLNMPVEPEIRHRTRLDPPPEVKEKPVTPKPTVDVKERPATALPLGPAPVPQTGGRDAGFKPAFMDGERIPLVRVQAQYPRTALERGVEGSVVVEFTVSEDGTVADAHVIEAQPKGMFDRAALQAIAKFKYKPTVIDGVARASSGVRYRFVFNLTD